MGSKIAVKKSEEGKIYITISPDCPCLLRMRLLVTPSAAFLHVADLYAMQCGFKTRHLKFFFDDKAVNLQNSPNQLGMREYSFVDVQHELDLTFGDLRPSSAVEKTFSSRYTKVVKTFPQN